MSLTISFVDGTPAEQNKHAQALMQSLREALPKDELEVVRERDDPHAQDLGATLIVTAGVTTVTQIIIEISGKAIAEVLKDYIERWYTTIRVRGGNIDLTANNKTESAELSTAIQKALGSSAGSSSSKSIGE